MTFPSSPYTRSDTSNTFSTTMYSSDPWARITTNQRKWYDPALRYMWRKKSIFKDFITYAINLGSVDAKTMEITTLIEPHANFDQIDPRALSMTAMHSDLKSQTVTFGAYGGKVQYHRYNDVTNYLRNGGSLDFPSSGAENAISTILNGELGKHLIQVQDKLARNALLGVPLKYYGNEGQRSSFGDIQSSDRVTTGLMDDIHLGMDQRFVPGWDRSDTGVPDIICVTTPGVLYDLQAQSDPAAWMYRNAYANPKILLNNEVGTFRNVRFIKSADAVLFNCGEIKSQHTVTSAITAGDGAPDPETDLVDTVYATGQPGATHYIQLDSGTDMTVYKLNEVVSIHAVRTNDHGVTGGVDYRDGKLHNLRVKKIDTVNKRLSFDRPVLEDFTTNLGSGVYAYVTRGRHIHPMIFIGGNEAVVMGYNQAPRFYTPPPIDDRQKIYRVAWDSLQGYQTYNPYLNEVAFVSASFREMGQKETDI